MHQNSFCQWKVKSGVPYRVIVLGVFARNSREQRVSHFHNQQHWVQHQLDLAAEAEGSLGQIYRRGLASSVRRGSQTASVVVRQLEGTVRGDVLVGVLNEFCRVGS